MKKFDWKLLFTILTLGGLWGVLEATLGTVLHFSGTAKIFLSSSIIMVPIAYAILSVGYKNTGKLRSVFLIGLVAGVIKLAAFAVPGIAVNVVVSPAISIVIEAAAFGLAVYLIKPESMLSYKGIAVILLAGISYRLTFTLYQLATVVPFGATSFTYKDGVLSFNETGFVKFNITQYAISSAYTIVLGLIALGIKKLMAAKNFKVNTESIKKIAYSPVMSVVMIGAAIALTIVLK